MLGISLNKWEFDAHIFGDGSTQSAVIDLLKTPFGLDFSTGLPSGVKFLSLYIGEKVSGNLATDKWADLSLDGSVLTLAFKNSGGNTTLSSGVRHIFVCQMVK